VRRALLTIGFFATIWGGLYCQASGAAEPLIAKMDSSSAESMRRQSAQRAVAEITKPPKLDDTIDQTGSAHRSVSQKLASELTASKPVKVYLLLGGVFGLDGPVTSTGMFALAKMLQSLPNTSVTTFTWDKWKEAYPLILENEGKAKIVVIGYSGGGSRATWLANMPPRPEIDLMISYDPSPKWQMKPIGANVKMALCYHNTAVMWLPGFGNFGGGRLINGELGNADGQSRMTRIETVNVAEQHMLVQFDQSLHRQTMEAVRSLGRSTPGQNSELASVRGTVTATQQSNPPPNHLSLSQNTE